jgi:hypothetical protein
MTRLCWLVVATTAAVLVYPIVKQVPSDSTPHERRPLERRRQEIPEICQHRPDASVCADSTYWVDPE